jgi:hypothetical protein
MEPAIPLIFLSESRQKVTLKEKGAHFATKFLLFQEQSSRFRGQIGFSSALLS